MYSNLLVCPHCGTTKAWNLLVSENLGQWTMIKADSHILPQTYKLGMLFWWLLINSASDDNSAMIHILNSTLL